MTTEEQKKKDKNAKKRKSQLQAIMSKLGLLQKTKKDIGKGSAKAEALKGIM